MSENNEMQDENIDFSEMLEKSLNRSDDFTVGDRVSGTVVHFSGSYVFVDISGKSEATMDLSEFLDKEGKPSIKCGDPITAYVVSTSGGEIHLTQKIGKGQANNELLGLSYRNNIPVHGTVADITKGGYTVLISGIRCFCPLSQIDIKSQAAPETYLSKSYAFKIIEFGESGKNIILSRRALLDEEKKLSEDELKKTLKEGDDIRGVITRIKDFGIFMDIGGIEGLVPKSELSRSRHSDLKKFSEGQQIQARVKTIDWDNKRISLSIKDLIPDPWEKIDTYDADRSINGTVVNIIKNGAFVELEPGLEGFVHISRMSLVKKVNRPEDVVAIGDSVSVKIAGINKEEKKLSLELLTGEADPWNLPEDVLMQGEHIGTIEAAKSAGINVRLANGMLGFVPKKELLFENADIQKKYSVGSEIKVAVREIDRDNRNCILSEIKALKNQENVDYQKFQEKNSSSQGSNLGSLFKDKFNEIQKNLNKH